MGYRHEADRAIYEGIQWRLAELREQRGRRDGPLVWASLLGAIDAAIAAAGEARAAGDRAGEHGWLQLAAWLMELRVRRERDDREPDDERNAGAALWPEPSYIGDSVNPELRQLPFEEPLRERLAQQTAEAQAEVERELAALLPGDGWCPVGCGAQIIDGICTACGSEVEP